MPFASATTPAAGLSTFWPSTSTPAAMRFFAAAVSFGGENHAFVQRSLHLGLGVRRLGAEGERVDVAHDLRDRRTGRCSRSDPSCSQRPQPCPRGRSCPRPHRSTRPWFFLIWQTGRLLEEDVRVLLVELPVDAVLEHAERAAEDHGVALADKAGDDLRHLRRSRRRSPCRSSRPCSRAPSRSRGGPRRAPATSHRRRAGPG